MQSYQIFPVHKFVLPRIEVGNFELSMVKLMLLNCGVGEDS